MNKHWYISKGVWLGVLIIAFGIAEYITGLPPAASIITIIAGCLQVIIRFVTKQGLIK